MVLRKEYYIMGNYYEGDIHFKLKKDTPKNIINLLEFLCNDYLGSWNAGAFKESFREIVNKFDVRCDDIEKYDAFPIVDIYDEIIRLSICTKHFSTNSILWLIDTCRPYMINDAPEDNYLGTISDEDGYYYKEFYIDENIFRKQMEERSAICNPTCARFIKDALCHNYSMCERAYNIGKAENEKL